ncbi:MAG: hypothetical protein LBC87_04100 [Fibromonadaceae bacterium]|jgi:hypothetical protein|nr:hypothetical protein [Fibromonadaceae bacterium]
MTIFKKEGRPDIEIHDDGTYWQEGERIENPPTAESLAANGWQEHIPEPQIETFSEPPSGSSTSSALISGLDALTPNRAAMLQLGQREWEDRDVPDAIKFMGKNLSGLGGLGMDVASAIYSPVRAAGSLGTPLAKKGFAAFLDSKPIQTAKNLVDKLNPSVSLPPVDKTISGFKAFLQAGLPKPGNIPAGKSMPALGFKNFLTNTGDAAIFNNAEHLAKGEDMQLGASELAGGLLGGAVGTAGEKKAVNDIMRARNAASKSAESLNFAERTTGKKGLRAVEQVIDENVAKYGTFENAVTNIRTDLDGLHKEMKNFLDVSGAKEIPYNSNHLLKKIDNYVLDKTSFLGNKNAREYANAANEAFNESLREIWVARMMPLKLGDRRFLSDQAAALTPEQLRKEVSNLTLEELNWMKVSMQDRSSHWQRSLGSMAREGTESLANKEASSAINNMLDGISTMADDAVGEWAERNVKTLMPTEAAKFREINKARSNAIGNLKIMEHADRVQARRNDFVSGISNAIIAANSQNRTATTPFARFMGIKGEQYRENQNEPRR